MAKKVTISKNRVEAFSDGVIAIIITLMVLEIRLPLIEESYTAGHTWQLLSGMLPHLFSYMLSFVVIGILWINHHSMFHQIKHTDNKLLWYNLHLLFWMSLIPLVTPLLGEHPFKPEATALYGFIMFTNAFAFTLMRWYAQDKANLYIENISQRLRRKYRVMNGISSGLYFASIFTGYISPYISLAIFVFIPAIYFMPLNVEVDNEAQA